VQHPDANIGLRPPVGTVVVDVDPRAGGASALVELTRPHGGLVPTWTAYTGGGGLQRLVPGHGCAAGEAVRRGGPETPVGARGGAALAARLWQALSLG